MSDSSTSGGIGFVGLLQILFIALKLTNTIDWTWFWVLAPIWLSFAFVGGILLLVLLFALIKVFTDK